MDRNCKHCHHTFQPKRKNNMYCCGSCKTMASYKRNNYKYVSGHYQKDNNLPDKKADSLMVPIKQMEEKLSVLESKKQTINLNSVSNAALGTAAANTVSYGLKKAFAPLSLPATKGDVEKLKNEIEELKKLLRNRNDTNLPFWQQ